MEKLYHGLALGGGGSRGVAHIGALQSLHENGIKPDLIAGVSAGSMIGAMYAATLDPAWIENRFRELMSSDLFTSFSFGSLMAGRNKETYLEEITTKVDSRYMIGLGLNEAYILPRSIIENAVEFMMPCNNFEELQIPLKVIATDIQNGQEIVYSNGNIKEAIIQSSSIPGFFEATDKNDKLIVDGGVTSPIPVKILKDYTEMVMAIDITNYELKPLTKPNMIEIMRRSDIITSLRLKNELARQADILVKPEVSGIHWSDFNNFDMLLERGKNAMMLTLETLKNSEPNRESIYYKLYSSLK
jgi:NTE family protein